MSVDPLVRVARDQPDPAVDEPRLSAHGFRLRYGSTTVLDGVDLDVRDGESVAIMGPSGSGKSTLLHAMTGVISPDEGEVTLRTRSWSRELVGLSDAERSTLRLREFGFVFEQGMLIPELTATENVAMPLLLTGTAKSPAMRRVAQLLGELGVAGLEDRRIGQLSGGQAQRVVIARALATDAHVVFRRRAHRRAGLGDGR